MSETGQELLAEQRVKEARARAQKMIDDKAALIERLQQELKEARAKTIRECENAIIEANLSDRDRRVARQAIRALLQGGKKE